MPPKRKHVSNDDFAESGDSDYELVMNNVKAKKLATKRKSNGENDIAEQSFDVVGTNGCVYSDFSHLKLKPDHMSRPIYVTPDHQIILEAFSPLYAQAYDFLVAIAEPESRPEYIHKYYLSHGVYSLMVMNDVGIG